jgi:hypothetical protein
MKHRLAPRNNSCTAIAASTDKAKHRKPNADRQALPILNHPLDEPSAFTARGLMQSVRTARKIPMGTLSPLCILDFDGDLTDWLVQTGLATRVPGWPGFHTTLYAVETEGMTCGITARTIGGPYAVLIAEQLAAAGVEWIIGLTSAGRISPELPPPLPDRGHNSYPG